MMPRAAFTAVLLSILLNAQARAPFTGIVRDESGKPLVGAEITCAFVPDFTAPGPPDRAMTKTDAEGRFGMQLVTGCSYVVWATGPKDEHGVRSVVWPRPEAAAGKTLDLDADERREPAKLKVSGVSPWMNDGPLSLRLFVGGCCLGADVVVPGDGVVSLPPVPLAQMSVGLIDGQGQVIQIVPCDLEVAAAVAFAAPREVAFVARDGDGKPLAGVRILQHGCTPGASVDRLNDRSDPSVPFMRAVGVTGPDGTTAGRIAGDPGLLCGRLAGHGDGWSGWLRGTRLQDSSTAPDEGPLAFVLRPAEARTLRILGLAKDEGAEAWFRGTRNRLQNGHGYMPYLLASTPAVDGLVAVEGAAEGTLVQAFIRLVSDSRVPRRVVSPTFGKEARVPDFDLSQLRRFAVSVVDPDGHPVPCCHLGVAYAAPGWVGWQTRLVTDGEGRAELFVNDTMDCMVYAIAGKANALQVIPKTAPAGAVVLQLEAMATMRLSIVDKEGHPVRGARLQLTSGDIGGGSRDALGKALDEVAQHVSLPSIVLWRSNAAGGLEVPFLDRQAIRFKFKVTAGTRTSGEVLLRSADAVQEVVVQ